MTDSFTMYKRSSFIKTYSIEDFELKNIHFFNKDGIVLSIGHGWFERIDHDLTVNLAIVTKRKPDFSLTSAFLIQIKRESYKKEGRHAELYMPYDFFEWETKKDARYIDVPTKRLWYDSIANKTIGFSHDIFSREEMLTNNVKYLEAVKPLFEIVADHVNEYSLIANKDKILEMLKKAVEKLEPNSVRVQFS